MSNVWKTIGTNLNIFWEWRSPFRPRVYRAVEEKMLLCTWNAHRDSVAGAEANVYYKEEESIFQPVARGMPPKDSVNRDCWVEFRDKNDPDINDKVATLYQDILYYYDVYRHERQGLFADNSWFLNCSWLILGPILKFIANAFAWFFSAKADNRVPDLILKNAIEELNAIADLAGCGDAQLKEFNARVKKGHLFYQAVGDRQANIFPSEYFSKDGDRSFYDMLRKLSVGFRGMIGQGGHEPSFASGWNDLIERRKVIAHYARGVLLNSVADFSKKKVSLNEYNPPRGPYVDAFMESSLLGLFLRRGLGYTRENAYAKATFSSKKIVANARAIKAVDDEKEKDEKSRFDEDNLLKLPDYFNEEYFITNGKGEIRPEWEKLFEGDEETVNELKTKLGYLRHQENVAGGSTLNRATNKGIAKVECVANKAWSAVGYPSLQKGFVSDATLIDFGGNNCKGLRKIYLDLAAMFELRRHYDDMLKVILTTRGNGGTRDTLFAASHVIRAWGEDAHTYDQLIENKMKELINAIDLKLEGVDQATKKKSQYTVHLMEARKSMDHFNVAREDFKLKLKEVLQYADANSSKADQNEIEILDRVLKSIKDKIPIITRTRQFAQQLGIKLKQPLKATEERFLIASIKQNIVLAERRMKAREGRGEPLDHTKRDEMNKALSERLGELVRQARVRNENQPLNKSLKRDIWREIGKLSSLGVMPAIVFDDQNEIARYKIEHSGYLRKKAGIFYDHFDRTFTAENSDEERSQEAKSQIECILEHLPIEFSRKTSNAHVRYLNTLIRNFSYWTDALNHMRDWSIRFCVEDRPDIKELKRAVNAEIRKIKAHRPYRWYDKKSRKCLDIWVGYFETMQTTLDQLDERLEAVDPVERWKTAERLLEQAEKKDENLQNWCEEIKQLNEIQNSEVTKAATKIYNQRPITQAQIREIRAHLWKQPITRDLLLACLQWSGYESKENEPYAAIEALLTTLGMRESATFYLDKLSETRASLAWRLYCLYAKNVSERRQTRLGTRILKDLNKAEIYLERAAKGGHPNAVKRLITEIGGGWRELPNDATSTVSERRDVCKKYLTWLCPQGNVYRFKLAFMLMAEDNQESYEQAFELIQDMIKPENYEDGYVGEVLVCDVHYFLRQIDKLNTVLEHARTQDDMVTETTNTLNVMKTMREGALERFECVWTEHRECLKDRMVENRQLLRRMAFIAMEIGGKSKVAFGEKSRMLFAKELFEKLAALSRHPLFETQSDADAVSEASSSNVSNKTGKPDKEEIIFEPLSSEEDEEKVELVLDWMNNMKNPDGRSDLPDFLNNRMLCHFLEDPAFEFHNMEALRAFAERARAEDEKRESDEALENKCLDAIIKHAEEEQYNAEKGELPFIEAHYRLLRQWDKRRLNLDDEKSSEEEKEKEVDRNIEHHLTAINKSLASLEDSDKIKKLKALRESLHKSNLELYPQDLLVLTESFSKKMERVKELALAYNKDDVSFLECYGERVQKEKFYGSRAVISRYWYVKKEKKKAFDYFKVVGATWMAKMAFIWGENDKKEDKFFNQSCAKMASDLLGSDNVKEAKKWFAAMKKPETMLSDNEVRKVYERVALIEEQEADNNQETPDGTDAATPRGKLAWHLFRYYEGKGNGGLAVMWINLAVTAGYSKAVERSNKDVGALFSTTDEVLRYQDQDTKFRNAKWAHDRIKGNNAGMAEEARSWFELNLSPVDNRLALVRYDLKISEMKEEKEEKEEKEGIISEETFNLLNVPAVWGATPATLNKFLTETQLHAIATHARTSQKKDAFNTALYCIKAIETTASLDYQSKLTKEEYRYLSVLEANEFPKRNVTLDNIGDKEHVVWLNALLAQGFPLSNASLKYLESKNRFFNNEQLSKINYEQIFFLGQEAFRSFSKKDKERAHYQERAKNYFTYLRENRNSDNLTKEFSSLYLARLNGDEFVMQEAVYLTNYNQAFVEKMKEAFKDGVLTSKNLYGFATYLHSNGKIEEAACYFKAFIDLEYSVPKENLVKARQPLRDFAKARLAQFNFDLDKRKVAFNNFSAMSSKGKKEGLKCFSAKFLGSIVPEYVNSFILSEEKVFTEEEKEKRLRKIDHCLALSKAISRSAVLTDQHRLAYWRGLILAWKSYGWNRYSTDAPSLFYKVLSAATLESVDLSSITSRPYGPAVAAMVDFYLGKKESWNNRLRDLLNDTSEGTKPCLYFLLQNLYQLLYVDKLNEDGFGNLEGATFLRLYRLEKGGGANTEIMKGCIDGILKQGPFSILYDLLTKDLYDAEDNALRGRVINAIQKGANFISYGKAPPYEKMTLANLLKTIQFLSNKVGSSDQYAISTHNTCLGAFLGRFQGGETCQDETLIDFLKLPYVEKSHKLACIQTMTKPKNIASYGRELLIQAGRIAVTEGRVALADKVREAIVNKTMLEKKRRVEDSVRKFEARNVLELEAALDIGDKAHAKKVVEDVIQYMKSVKSVIRPDGLFRVLYQFRERVLVEQLTVAMISELYRHDCLIARSLKLNKDKLFNAMKLAYQHNYIDLYEWCEKTIYELNGSHIWQMIHTKLSNEEKIGEREEAKWEEKIDAAQHNDRLRSILKEKNNGRKERAFKHLIRKAKPYVVLGTMRILYEEKQPQLATHCANAWVEFECIKKNFPISEKGCSEYDLYLAMKMAVRYQDIDSVLIYLAKIEDNQLKKEALRFMPQDVIDKKIRELATRSIEAIEATKDIKDIKEATTRFDKYKMQLEEGGKLNDVGILRVISNRFSGIYKSLSGKFVSYDTNTANSIEKSMFDVSIRSMVDCDDCDRLTGLIRLRGKRTDGKKNVFASDVSSQTDLFNKNKNSKTSDQGRRRSNVVVNLRLTRGQEEVCTSP